MIRVIPFLLYLWLAAAHQVFLGDITSIAGAVINLPALLVLLVSLYKSELDTCWFAFFIGMVAYIGYGDATGWYILLMAAIGFGTYHVRVRINLESVYSRLVVVFIGVLVHNAVVMATAGGDGSFAILLVRVLSGAVYTSVVAWLFFLVKEGKITYQKLRAIF
ncbi:MAG: rod shape-determining protein MreD [Candidatus Zixiibacteriota bacterium]|nr:MAG: rod shape-determining protein MreD [candidate division Zixibacteria bacterium]